MNGGQAQISVRLAEFRFRLLRVAYRRQFEALESLH